MLYNIKCHHGVKKMKGKIKMDSIKETENTAPKKSKEPKNEHKSHKSILDMVYIAMFTAIICVCSIIKIPIEPVQITLQTFAVCVTAAMLGKRGVISVILYILIGSIGIPVFSGSGGFSVVMGMTGGYIVGFIFTALIVGFIADKFNRKLIPTVISMVVGVLVCYAFGTPWFMAVTNTDFAYAFSVCVLPFLIPDAVKIAVAAIIVNRLNKIIKL